MVSPAGSRCVSVAVRALVHGEAERVCAEQPVVAGVPVGRVSEVGRVVEQRDAQRPAADRARVVAPRRASAEDLGLADGAVGVLDTAAAHLVHRARDPDRDHRGLLGVAEADVLIGGSQADVQVDGPRVSEVVEGHVAGLAQQHGVPVGRDPVGLGDGAAVDRPVDQCAEGAVKGEAGHVALAPVVDGADVAVGQPYAPVVRVVNGLSRHPGDHREVSRERLAARTDDGMEVRPASAASAQVVAGERPVAEQHVQPAGRLGQPHAAVVVRRRRPALGPVDARLAGSQAALDPGENAAGAVRGPLARRLAPGVDVPHRRGRRFEGRLDARAHGRGVHVVGGAGDGYGDGGSGHPRVPAQVGRNAVKGTTPGSPISPGPGEAAFRPLPYSRWLAMSR